MRARLGWPNMTGKSVVHLVTLDASVFRIPSIFPQAKEEPSLVTTIKPWTYVMPITTAGGLTEKVKVNIVVIHLGVGINA